MAETSIGLQSRWAGLGRARAKIVGRGATDQPAVAFVMDGAVIVKLASPSQALIDAFVAELDAQRAAVADEITALGLTPGAPAI